MEQHLFPNLERYQAILHQYGFNLVRALVFLVIGLILMKAIARGLRLLLAKTRLKPATAATSTNVVKAILLLVVLLSAATEAGLDTRLVIRSLVVVTLAAVALIMLFRPYIPNLPFKTGNTIRTGAWLGKVEATTFINTRVRTFDGKTVFIPNSKILNDFVINYQFTPNRRIKIDVCVGYDQDLMKAKQTLEALMIADPRVVTDPRPVVYVLNLKLGYIELGGRAWVNNKVFWATRCDLVERTKFAFDQAGIKFANPKLDIFRHEGVSTDGVGGDEHWESQTWPEDYDMIGPKESEVPA
ncbi:MAG: mechanosensitive ion channel domain-containing protein [Pseudomonadota bacterium]